MGDEMTAVPRPRRRVLLKTSVRVLLAAVVLLFVVPTGVYVYKAVRCPAEYDSMVNDWCGARTPPQDALPVPDAWRVVETRESCGSGGCFDRLYVLEPPDPDDSVRAYADYLAGVGWRVTTDGRTQASHENLQVEIEKFTPDTARVLGLDTASGRSLVLASLHYSDYGQRWRDK